MPAPNPPQDASNTDTAPSTPPSLAALAAQVEALDREVTGLADQQHAVRLRRILHRPGWTAKPEAQSVGALVVHLQEQLAGLGRAHTALLAAADQIARS